ncbi:MULTISPECIES: YceI family protein [unclassified Corallococcus]|uniref:YceI family protein n=1 Tax=unclassified Corallococcus TaxID=2685029 RepID=UPI001A8C5F76|nr:MULTISPECIES: YceI family protein [unclassified Corallococcus]MBN9682777.1 YceI family protein [Corallococcus sp. NCSPR001]WAS85684.1 YceI family protein [Corallococcus sp. NCRR]
MSLPSWNIDPAHSAVLFIARHMVVARVHGRFERVSGTLKADPQSPLQGEVDVRVEAASIYTGNPERDAHLRSPEFLDAEAAPLITFRASQSHATGGTAFQLQGELTLRRVTRPLLLEVRHLATTQDPWGQSRLLYSARTSLQRSDFGIQWNRALDNGGWLIGEKVDIELDIQATPAKG